MIPFSFFVSLLSDISKVAAKTRDSNPTRSNTSKSRDYPALRVFSRWVEYLRTTFETQVIADSSVAIFRLLFPEMDVDRRYDIQEARLGQHLAGVFDASNNSAGRGSSLARWNEDGSRGCLGAEVRKAMRAPVGVTEGSVGLGILQVDGLLTQLASLSSFSHPTIQTNPNLPSSRAEIIKALYSSLSPTEASFLTQIILKDLRPVLYPSKETHYTAALKGQKSNSVTPLGVVDALRAWDPTLDALSRWRVVSSFEIALSNNDGGLMSFGNPLQIPKTIKGTGCARALNLFSDSQLVWAETKYDGERAQIHVKVDQKTGSVELKIFSKSKRESTDDRHAVHQVILDALGLPGSAAPSSKRSGMSCVMRDAIIEAEMVAFSDTTGRIDEFWRIRSLIESTAVGPRHKVRKMHEETPAISQCSLRSDASDGGTRHLALVFFDVLLLDSRPLTGLPYHQRRKIMESIVLPIPGFSLLAERSPIDLTKGIHPASAQLKSVLARVIADHQEGLVLKANEGAYIKSPWVKLKRDYIPGLGDGIDLVIVGACWEKDRGRELRVPPSAFTTFHLGILTNAGCLRDDPNTTPSFRAFFSTSYGLGRDQLEDLNFIIKSSNSMTYGEYSRNPYRLGYDMSLFIGQSQPKPSVVLLKDSLILAEVFGAGFTKAPGGKYYELRFPRMTKAYRRRERTWRECISLEEFQRIARETVGRERPNKEADDWCKSLFGKVASPGVRHPLRRKQREETILAELERIERRHFDGGGKSKDRNGGKKERTRDPGRHSKDRRPYHRESTCSENVGQAIERSPLGAVFAQQRGFVPSTPPITPTRPGLVRRLVPLGSVTNVAISNPTTPLDDQNRDRLGSGREGESERPMTRSAGNRDLLVDEADYKTGHRTDLHSKHPFTTPAPCLLLSPSTTIPHRKRMGLQDNSNLHVTSSDPPIRANTDVQPATEQVAPDVECNSPSVAGRSLPIDMSSGPVEHVFPPANLPTVPAVQDAPTGVKRKREAAEGVHPPPKKIMTGSSSSVQKVSNSSRDLKLSETWSPEKPPFIEEPHSTCGVPKSKTRGGNMSVDAIKNPDATTGNLAVAIQRCDTEPARMEEKTRPIMNQKTLEDGAEPVRRKTASTTFAFRIPAPFPPGTSGPGSTTGCPNNSDKIAAYHGADKFYSSRPPPSTTPPQPPKAPRSADESGMLIPPVVGDMGKDLSTEQPEQLKFGDSKKILERFPSFVLHPQLLLFTDTPVGNLMSTSVVWFARDLNVPEPSYRPSSLQLVPRLNEVSQLESLLVACGWHRRIGFNSKRGVEKGVIFIDYEQQTDIQPAVKTHLVAQQCENAYRLATRHQDPTERGMKPIWIVDAKVLRWERLQSMECVNALDALEEFILWRKE